MPVVRALFDDAGGNLAPAGLHAACPAAEFPVIRAFHTAAETGQIRDPEQMSLVEHP